MRWLLLCCVCLLGAPACKGGCACGNTPTPAAKPQPKPAPAPKARPVRRFAPTTGKDAAAVDPSAAAPAKPVDAGVKRPDSRASDSGSSAPSPAIGQPDGAPTPYKASPEVPVGALDGGVFAPKIEVYNDASKAAPVQPSSDAGFKPKDAAIYNDAFKVDPNAPPLPDGGSFKPPDMGYFDASR